MDGKNNTNSIEDIIRISAQDGPKTPKELGLDSSDNNTKGIVSLSEGVQILRHSFDDDNSI